MTEADIIRIVRRVMLQEIQPMLVGIILSNESESRSTAQRLSNEGPRPNLRTIMPFGVASKAPAGTQALIAQAGDSTNQNILGHYDTNRPALKDGEACLYDAYGHVLYVSQSGIHFGTEGSTQNVVLGQVFKTMMDTLLQALAQHTHPGIGAPPSNASSFTSLKASPIDDNSILSQVTFTE